MEYIFIHRSKDWCQPLRSRLAQGLVPNGLSGKNAPEGANIYSMNYSTDLENAAQKYADNCPNSGSSLVSRNSSGENFGIVASNTAKSYHDAVFHALRSFWDEIKSFIIDKEMEYTYVLTQRNKAPLRFTQMAWAKTYQVGCGARLCGSHYVVVCRYNPRGNILWEKIYETGTTCGTCPDIYSTDLENDAQKYADNCPTSGSSLMSRNSSGENFGIVSSNTAKSYYDAVFHALRSFWDEIKSFIIDKEMEYTYVLTRRKQAPLRFTQMAWAKTYQVGCGARLCGSYYVVVCRYNPRGNILWEKIYETGTTCGTCPDVSLLLLGDSTQQITEGSGFIIPQLNELRARAAGGLLKGLPPSASMFTVMFYYKLTEAGCSYKECNTSAKFAMAWATTYQVGCGAKLCNGNYVVVCRYNPRCQWVIAFRHLVVGMRLEEMPSSLANVLIHFCYCVVAMQSNMAIL
ncbi:SCP-like protein [Teladorsagia circumcincta]|uniref:SCP-like protein n=1 Tax=Teladorsagia circumcincta TaxID=45464 RepID=A0A2G9UPY5_TELCI|nr:SCP-like protein [Teladorsagia circumcincta]